MPCPRTRNQDWTLKWADIKVAVSPGQLLLRGIPSVLHSQLSLCRGTVPSLVCGAFMPPPSLAGRSRPSLGGELELVQFIFDIFTLAMAGAAPRVSACTHRLFVNRSLASGRLRGKALASDAKPFSLAPPVCRLSLSLFGGAAWALFFLVCVLIINTFCLQVKCLQEQS